MTHVDTFWNLVVSLLSTSVAENSSSTDRGRSPAMWKDAFFAAAEIFEKDEALCKWESLESLSEICARGRCGYHRSWTWWNPHGIPVGRATRKVRSSDFWARSEYFESRWIKASSQKPSQEGLPHWSHAIQEVAQQLWCLAGGAQTLWKGWPLWWMVSGGKDWGRCENCLIWSNIRY